ncbi:hypothetical protein GH714_018443 [Hevea brasiliensis]|uniref:Glycosyltransferase family 28 N-terminal domain-containing protein n=1 Tax=Hevea brasiliensis TaxID=3981 RepID=A0A6A6N5C7_HEVBR|nr:hypothetical protein GH714_018443 [Hevea brasiliensis]
MGTETEKRNPVALFMAFGTKGDVYPIAAIAAAFGHDQNQYHVVLVTHSAHENLRSHLEDRHVNFLPIKSPSVISIHESYNSTETEESAFSLQKRIISREHRRKCYSVVEGIFGHGPSMEGDFIVINFFALEGWSLAEHFRVRCVVASPYVIPYSAPSSFEHQFRKELPLLYEYLQEAPTNKVCWKDVIHWMWPLFTENWGSWRSDDLNLSPIPFTDPVTGLPTWHDWPPFPLLYGFSKEIVECPGYEPLDEAIQVVATKTLHFDQRQYSEEGVCLFDGRLFCFPSMIPYNWLFKKCLAGSSWGKVLCPFMLDQFYWAERMYWLGVAPEPLKRNHLVPDKMDDFRIRVAANVLSRAIAYALSPEVKECALKIAEMISLEDGVMEAVKVLKQEMTCSN